MKEGKAIDSLGSPEELGSKVAKLREMKLASAEDLSIGGIPTYILELEGGGGKELIGFSVAKGKLWRITAKASNARWAKNKEMYRTIITSFQPRIL